MIRNLEKMYGPEILINYADNMADMARRWGKKSFDDRNVSFVPKDIGARGDLEIVVSPDPKNQTVLVKKASAEGDLNNFSPEMRNIVRLPARRKVSPGVVMSVTDIDEGMMIWETDMDLIDVTRIMLDCDDIGRRKGLVVDGRRVNAPGISEYRVQTKRPVETTFADIGTFFPLLDGVSYEDEVLKFDNPDDLTPRIDPYSGKVIGIIKKSQTPYFEEMDRVLNDVLIEKGLTYPELVTVTIQDPDTFMPLFRAVKVEVSKRMKEKYKSE